MVQVTLLEPTIRSHELRSQKRLEVTQESRVQWFIQGSTSELYNTTDQQQSFISGSSQIVSLSSLIISRGQATSVT